MDFLNTAEKRDRRMIHIPMGRFGEAIEQAKAALFRASPKTALLAKILTLWSRVVASDESSYITVISITVDRNSDAD